ncbi:MAG: hypothetical protein IPG69_05025 [Flavobacteriales bacterium]|nr:hypothetical protein [Flavobacteriales bacterium]
MDISETVLQIFHDTDIVQVFALPDMTWTYDSLSQTLCLGDTALVSVTWFLDGDTIPNATGLCVQTNDPGSYWATGTNGFGCTGQSDTLVIAPHHRYVRHRHRTPTTVSPPTLGPSTAT